MKTKDGRWRKGDIGVCVVWCVLAVYDFLREGLRSLSGIQFMLFAIGLAALAPSQDEPKEHRVKGWILRSPRYCFGVVALVAAVGVLAYRMAGDIRH